MGKGGVKLERIAGEGESWSRTAAGGERLQNRAGLLAEGGCGTWVMRAEFGFKGPVPGLASKTAPSPASHDVFPAVLQ